VAVDLAAAPAPGLRALRAVGLAVPARAALAGVVALSAVVRALASVTHTTPYFFPDEYLYPTFARGFAEHGHPVVRGASAHFPALLEPLLAAPFWLTHDPALALRLTQVMHAVVFSLAAVPVYLLARRLDVPSWLALGAAVFALVIPDGMYAGWLLSDAVAYPFVLFAVYFGVRWLSEPTRTTRAAFVAFAVLSVFARIQYVVVPVAVLLAAAVLQRSRLRSLLRWRYAVAALAFAAVLALGWDRILGPYAHPPAGLHPLGLVHWLARDAFLLAYASPWLLVPGALVALARPRTKTETAFSLLFGFLAFGLLLEAAEIAAIDSSRFEERYLFSLLPLLAVAFGLYVRRGLPHRLAVALVSFALLVLSAKIPLAGFAAAHNRDDSPLLYAVIKLTDVLDSASSASLVFAAVAAVLSLLAVALPFRPRVGPAVALGLTLVAAGALSYGASATDDYMSTQTRKNTLPAARDWVDRTGLQDVAVLQLPGAQPQYTWEQLLWNHSLSTELLLGGKATDDYQSKAVTVAPDGTLLVDGEALHRPVLAQTYASTVSFAGARELAHSAQFSLWQPSRAVRLRLLAAGRYSDGWLSGTGGIGLWGKRLHGTLELTLTLPAGLRPATVVFRGGADRAVRLLPGRPQRVSLPVDARGAWSVSFHADPVANIDGLRTVAAKASVPRFVPW
jgi:hypothetical protein